MNENSDHVSSSQRLKELIFKPSNPGQQLTIPSYLSLHLRASLDLGLALGKDGERKRKGSRSSLDFCFTL